MLDVRHGCWACKAWVTQIFMPIICGNNPAVGIAFAACFSINCVGSVGFLPFCAGYFTTEIHFFLAK